MRRVIDADPRPARRTGLPGSANFTCAGGARAGSGGRYRLRAGPSGLLACMRSRRKPVPQQATARSRMRPSRLPQVRHWAMTERNCCRAASSSARSSDVDSSRYLPAWPVRSAVFGVAGPSPSTSASEPPPRGASRKPSSSSGKTTWPRSGKPQTPPLWWTDGAGQADPSHLRLRRT